MKKTEDCTKIPFNVKLVFICHCIEMSSVSVLDVKSLLFSSKGKISPNILQIGSLTIKRQSSHKERLNNNKRGRHLRALAVRKETMSCEVENNFILAVGLLG